MQQAPRPAASSSRTSPTPLSNRAVDRRAAQVEQQRRAQSLRDTQLGEAEVDDESAWPEWESQPLQLRLARFGVLERSPPKLGAFASF